MLVLSADRALPSFGSIIEAIASAEDAEAEPQISPWLVIFSAVIVVVSTHGNYEFSCRRIQRIQPPHSNEP